MGNGEQKKNSVGIFISFQYPRHSLWTCKDSVLSEWPIAWHVFGHEQGAKGNITAFKIDAICSPQQSTNKHAISLVRIGVQDIQMSCH